jgi:hypothetical protein
VKRILHAAAARAGGSAGHLAFVKTSTPVQLRTMYSFKLVDAMLAMMEDGSLPS